MELFENNTFLLLLILWTIPWKGVALWKAARKKHKRWFIVLLVVNTAALLEAAYIFYFSEPRATMPRGKKSKDTEQNI